MNEGFVEAEIGAEHEKFHVKVRQSRDWYQRRVELKMPERGEYVFISDALADIIVRGIRSLEEERAMRLSKTSMHAVPGATVEEIVDDGEPAVEALYRLMPGLSDSGETLQGREPADYESEVQDDWGYED